jgi:signal transduction histidine kinase/CheY-like chemotaxis protein
MSLTHLVIIDGQAKPVGLLTKNFFYDKTGGPFGFSLFAGKNADTIATSPFLAIDESTTIPDAARIAMQRSQNTQYDPVVIIQSNGKFMGTVLISDLLERFQDELIKHRELADLANRSKSVFLANMSHEIRTPLNAIIGFSDILEMELSDPEHRKYLSYINNAGNVLLNLISDILDLSRIDAGKLDIKCEKIIITDTLNELFHMFQWKAQSKNLNLQFETSDELSEPIMIDGLRIRQILINLIGNAIKFTDKGFVKVRTLSSSNKIIFIVEDSGIGIPMDQQARIFEAFNQCDGQDLAKYGGTGLGLTITQQLAHLMDGNIQLVSKHGQGSTFTVELPLHLFHEKTVISKTYGVGDDHAYNFCGSVLIVDDVEYNRLLLKALLKNHDLTIYEAVDGIDAIEMAKKVCPDIILMDIKMPRMDGYDATRKIRLISHLISVPVIAMSAATPALNNFDASLFQEYIMKPFQHKQIYEAIDKHLKTSRQDKLITPCAGF